MFVIPRRNVVPHNTDRLVAALGRHERRLQGWIAASEKNAELFRRDPVAAMREAGLQIEDDLICELEQLIGGIAAKLKK
jgi:hypothetical protein